MTNLPNVLRSSAVPFRQIDNVFDNLFNDFFNTVSGPRAIKIVISMQDNADLCHRVLFWM